MTFSFRVSRTFSYLFRFNFIDFSKRHVTKLKKLAVRGCQIKTREQFNDTSVRLVFTTEGVY